MAGYIIYSLDWHKFQQFVERPTADQLAALEKLLSEGLEENDGEFDEDDLVLTWPTQAGALAQIAAKRLALPDWYGDLSTPGKNLWEGVVFQACMNCDEIDVGFRVDSNGVYWDVIEAAWKHLGVVPGQISTIALSAFGKRPYRYHPPSRMVKTREQHDQEEEDRRSSLTALSSKRDFGRFSGRLKSHGPAWAVGAGSESTSRRLSSQGTRCSAALNRSKTGCNASCSANSSSQTSTSQFGVLSLRLQRPD